MSGQTDPEKRAMFLASLEFGVNPIARADYSKAPRPFTREEDRADATEAAEAYQRHLASKRPTRHLVVTAADILAGVES